MNCFPRRFRCFQEEKREQKMRLKTLQKWCAAAGIVAVAGTLVASGRYSTHKADYEFWNLPRWNAELQEAEETNEQLSVEATVVGERIAAKETMVVDLVAGRTSLAEVLDRFRELNAGNEELQAQMELRYPNQSEDERLYQNVLDFVRAECDERSDYPAVKARLAYEWQQLHSRRTRLN
jgi:hypothetical protein